MEHTIIRVAGTFKYSVSEPASPSWKYKSWVVCKADTVYGKLDNAKAFPLSVEKMDECFNEWAGGKLVQNAFPMLNADDREWLLTGGL